MTLSFSDVSFAYHPGRTVVRRVSMTVRAGRVTALIGPNGAGKSTLLRLGLGVLTPGAGEVRINGDRTDQMDDRVRAGRLAYVSQRSSLTFAYTAAQVVGFGRHALAGTGGEVDRALARVGGAELARTAFAELSVGQQQRVMLARALAQLDHPGDHPRALLADEPMSSMDPRHVWATVRVIREIAAAGVAVLVVVHDLQTALRVADDAALMDESGRLEMFDSAERVLTPDNLGRVFRVGFEAVPALGKPRAIIVAEGP